jgi:hypothetical protein
MHDLGVSFVLYLCSILIIDVNSHVLCRSRRCCWTGIVALRDHKRTECPLRKVVCRFCSVTFAAVQLDGQSVLELVALFPRSTIPASVCRVSLLVVDNSIVSLFLWLRRARGQVRQADGAVRRLQAVHHAGGARGLCVFCLCLVQSYVEPRVSGQRLIA